MLSAPAGPMGCFVIRCRSRTPVPAVELTDWLEARLAELREETPRLLARLARLPRDPADPALDDGWLIEVEPPGDRPDERPGSCLASLGELLRDLRILGLDPDVLVPIGLPFEEIRGP